MNKDLAALFPVCVVYDPFQVKTLADVEYLLQHEIDLFEEGQDAAMTKREIGTIRKALERVQKLRKDAIG